jgi:hypothetical protein
MPEGHRHAYVRLPLLNHGRTPAERVEVVVESMSDLTPEEVRGPRATLGRQSPEAVAGRVLKWADRDEPTVDIPPGTYRRFDLVHIIDDEPVVTLSGVRQQPLRLSLARESRSGRHVFSATHFVLRLTVAGSNFRPRHFDIEIGYAGRWDAGSNTWPSVQKALRISRPRRLRAATGWRAKRKPLLDASAVPGSESQVTKTPIQDQQPQAGEVGGEKHEVVNSEAPHSGKQG